MALVAHTGPGRPRKYGRPSRAITLTLPEDVLLRLANVDPDLGRAIVALAEDRAPARRKGRRAAEVASYGSHGVIVVTPTRGLKRIAGVQLVPIGDGRALIALKGGRSIAQLELDLRDVLAGLGPEGIEREAVEAVSEILRDARLSKRVVLEERTIIVLEAKRPRRTG